MARTKAEEATMVEEVKEKEIVPYSDEDRVEIPPLFYDKDRYSSPVIVGVNGKMYSIPRGISGIKVPRAVKEILDQSEYQKQMAGNFMHSIEGVKNLGNF